MEKYFTQTFDLQKQTELKDLGRKLKSNFNPKIHPQSNEYKKLMQSNTNIFNLTKKESLILRARFGIGYFKARTYEEIGNKIKVTRERVRQLESRALRKLKIHKKIFKNYYEYI